MGRWGEAAIYGAEKARVNGLAPAGYKAQNYDEYANRGFAAGQAQPERTVHDAQNNSRGRTNKR